MLLLLETPWVRSEHDPERRLVRYTRTALGFSTIIELEQSYGALILSTQQMDRTRLGLLVDLREAPPRNDPTFEQVMGVYRSRM
nr:hypothetical protein [Polyangiaceae bacterium]